MSDIALFSGNSNRDLAIKIAKNLTLPLGRVNVGRFSDGEVQVDLLENVRGRDVFIIQPTCPPFVNDSLMELLVLVDAMRRSSAGRITAVIPYFGYSRQDRRPRDARAAVSAKLVANLLQASGVSHVVTVDIHADQIIGFFDIPMDNVFASTLLLGDIWKQNFPIPIVVSPDVGGVTRARAFAKRLDDADLAIIDKRRPKPNESRVMNIIGDVKDRTCILVDDMVDTAGTLCKAADALMEKGAGKVVAYITHPILSGNAIKTIENSSLAALVVTDTIPLSEAAEECSKIRQLTISSLLAETIDRIHDDRSVSSLYVD